MKWILNTSNEGKLLEFQRLFGKYDVTLDVTRIDLPEIHADHLTVLTHKASQLPEMTLVEDTSLEVEGADVGINIRWLLAHLAPYIGKKALWTVLLGYRKGDKIYIYKGEVTGTIVEPRGTKGFGFAPVFLPLNSTQTLAEDKPDSVSARALAIEALMNNTPFAIVDPIFNWDGPWQTLS